jgi:hypothetical protein
MRNSLLLSVAAASLVTAASAATAGTWVPANAAAGSTSFTLFGINDNDITTGNYINSSSVQVGFVGPFDGSNYTTFTDGGSATQPRALNDKSFITGFDTGTTDEWERYATGKLKPITKSGTVITGTAQGINKSGTFTGNYVNSSGVETGYLGLKAKYQSDVSLSITNSGYAARAIDSAGDVGGWYYDSSGIQHGYVIVGGKAKKIDFPGSKTYYTVVEGMNDKGYLSGQWEDTSGVIHGFVYDISKNKYKSLDAPGASFTQVWGINNHDVVAASADVSGAITSFVYCIKTTGCPTPGVFVHKAAPPSSGNVKPEMP